MERAGAMGIVSGAMEDVMIKVYLKLIVNGTIGYRKSQSIPFPAGSVQVNCGNHFFGPNHLKFEGHCYLFVSKLRTWKDARNQCQRLGVTMIKSERF